MNRLFIVLALLLGMRLSTANASTDALSCKAALLVTSPRGIACLHCNQTEAALQASTLTDILVKACIQRVAINFLVDGTFGFSPEFMKAQIEKLTSGGRELYLTFYLTNGPGQRRYREGVFRGFGTDISPELFRDRIQSDSEFQGQYQVLVTRLIPLISFAVDRSAKVSLVPMLEDNLSDAAFAKLLTLTKSVVPPTLNVRYGRSPCSSCYPGNDDGAPADTFVEQHTASAKQVRVRNGIVTNDGVEVAEYSALGGVLRRAGKLGNQFIIWSGKFQGVAADGILRDPAKRDYPMPDPQDEQEIVRLLRK